MPAAACLRAGGENPGNAVIYCQNRVSKDHTPSSSRGAVATVFSLVQEGGHLLGGFGRVTRQPQKQGAHGQLIERIVVLLAKLFHRACEFSGLATEGVCTDGVCGVDLGSQDHICRGRRMLLQHVPHGPQQGRAPGNLGVAIRFIADADQKVDADTEHIRRWEVEHGMVPTPIVALTANAFEEDSRRCFAAGMDDFLTKPVNLQALQQMLAKWLVAPTPAPSAERSRS